MYNRAKLKYNDEDYGFIPITRAPFSKIRLPEHVPAKRAISLETLQQIAEILQVDLKDLITDKDERQ